MKHKRLIIVSAGGTGGHVFPAISLISNLNINKYRSEFLTDSRCEYILKKTKINYKIISSSSIPNNFFYLPKAVFKILLGIFNCLRIFKKKTPSVVIGFGGYVSLPAIIAARILGIPTVIHEQNSVMGKANRFLSYFSTYVALTYKNTKYSKNTENIFITGMPLRKEFYRKHKKTQSHKKTILIIGGSQGARFFSQLIPKLIIYLKKKKMQNFIIIQQVIARDKKKIEKFYSKEKIKFQLKTFFPEIYKEIFKADLIISRCGAATLQEIAAFDKTSILFPLPNSKDNHQYINAKIFKENNITYIFDENNFEINHFLKTVKSVIIKQHIQKTSKKTPNTGFQTLIDNIFKE